MSFQFSRRDLTPEEAERVWFSRLLWRAFPEADSENQLCDLVALHLSTEKRRINPRTVRNWVRCENSPHFRYVLPIITLAGAECLFALGEGHR